MAFEFETKPPKGTEFAERFSRVTRALKLLPPVDWLIVGKERKNVPDGWHVLDGQPAFVLGSHNWSKFEGDPTATNLPIPRWAHFAGIVAVESDTMDRAREATRGGRDALAIKFEEAVVIGALPEGQSFAGGVEEGYELVAARILRGPLEMMPGRVLGEIGIFGHGGFQFHPAPPPMGEEFRMRVPIEEVPTRIPIL
ncbi:MAG TPA: hypothetical protein VLG92_05255 [Candidatus Saccharimonadia bacterium]|nr:hypothetical protein [Candidatus Saccharimonadia bacterium]